MVNGEAKEFGGDRVSFDVVEKGEGGDKKVKVRALVVLDSKVIYHQGKDDVTRDVTEETGGGGKGKREFLAKFSKIIQSPAL